MKVPEGRSELGHGEIPGWVLALATTLTIAIACLYCRADLLGRVSTDNSLLQWYAGVQRLSHPTITKEINDAVYPLLVERFSDNGRSIYPPRFKQRMDNYVNYPAPTLLYYAVCSYIDRNIIPAAQDFAQYLKRTLTLMWLPAMVLTFALLFLVTSFLRDRLVAIAALLSLLGIAAVDFLPIVSAPPHYIWNLYFFDAQGVAKPIHKTFNLVLGDIRRSFWLVPHPGPAFSPFAFEPKTNFMILLMGVFALRWSGAFRSSYTLLFAASLFEQGYGMLFGLFLAVIDTICEPKRVINPIALCACALAVIPNLLFGQWWELIGFQFAIVMLLGAIIICAALFYFGGLPAQLLGFSLRPYFWLRAKVAGLSGPTADILLLATIWFASLLAVVPISVTSSIYRSQTFWGAVHGRLLGLVVPVLWMAMLVHLLGFAQTKLGVHFNRSLAPAAILLSISAYLGAPASADPFTRMDNEIKEYEAALFDPLVRYDRRTESQLYWAILKSVDTGQNWLTKFLPEAHLGLPTPDWRRTDTR